MKGYANGPREDPAFDVGRLENGADKRERLCPAAQIAIGYLSAAIDEIDRRGRARRLLVFAGRRAFGMNQSEIAAGIGLDQSHVSRDLAEVRPELEAIAARLGLSAESLFRRKGQPDRPEDESDQ